MTKPFHWATALLVAALVCSAAGAQMRGGVSAMRMSSVRAVPLGQVSSAAPRAIGQVRPLRTLFANSTAFGSTSGVPGLGFDYPHLAAIGGGVRNRAPGNLGRGIHRRQNAIVPIVIGGYPYYYYGDYGSDASDYEQPQQQPQVIEPVPMTPQAADLYNAPEAPLTPPVAAPVRDVGDFLLVRRDGRILFASAFSVSGAQVTYVTPEGIRRTLPLTGLDADATQQMNEARGTTVQIPN